MCLSPVFVKLALIEVNGGFMVKHMFRLSVKNYSVLARSELKNALV